MGERFKWKGKIVQFGHRYCFLKVFSLRELKSWAFLASKLYGSCSIVYYVTVCGRYSSQTVPTSTVPPKKKRNKSPKPPLKYSFLVFLQIALKTWEKSFGPSTSNIVSLQGTRNPQLGSWVVQTQHKLRVSTGCITTPRGLTHWLFGWVEGDLRVQASYGNL